jgi:hypothetical protein
MCYEPNYALLQVTIKAIMGYILILQLSTFVIKQDSEQQDSSGT